MAISIVGTPTTNGATNGGNFSITLPSGLAQNDLVVVFATGTAETNLGTSSSGWTTHGPYDSTSSTVRVNLFSKLMGATPDTTIAITGVTGAANSNNGIAIGLRGIDLTTPVESIATTLNGSGNNPDPPAVTPTFDHSMILVFGGDVSGTGDAAVTAPTNYTARGAVSTADNNDATSHGASRALGAGTGGVSENPGAWGSWTATNWNALTVVIRPRTVVAATTSYAYTANDVSPEHGWEIVPEAASYSFTAAAVTFAKGQKIVPDAASYTYTAQDITIDRTWKVVPETASYSFTADAVSLEHGWVIVAGATSFAYTAQNVDFVYTPNEALTIAADSASYSFTAEATSLEHGWEVNADSVSFSFTADAVSPEHGWEIVAGEASYAFTAQDATFNLGKIVALDGASYAYTAEAVSLEHGWEVLAEATSYAYTANAVEFVYTPLAAEPRGGNSSTTTTTKKPKRLWWHSPPKSKQKRRKLLEQEIRETMAEVSPTKAEINLVAHRLLQENTFNELAAQAERAEETIRAAWETHVQRERERKRRQAIHDDDEAVLLAI